MSNSGDFFIYNSSREVQSNEWVIQRKEILTQMDSNGGSYSNGVIDFELSSLSNSGAVVDYKNAKLFIPYVVKVYGNVIDDNVMNCWALSMKNQLHCIDQISVQMNNNNVVEIIEGSNIPLTFKLLTELSEQELNLLGPSIGFQKDSAFGLSVSSASSAFAPQGYEYNNNSNAAIVDIADNKGFTDGTIGFSGVNSAISKRQMDTSYDLTDVAKATARSAANRTGKNFCVRGTDYIAYHGIFIMELKYLSDYFAKMPLMRNTYLSLKIYTNLQSMTTVNLEPTDHNKYLSFTSSLSAKTCPYTIAPIGKGLKLKAHAALVSDSFTIESGIVKLSDSANNGQHSYTNCRIICPTYVFEDKFYQNYFANPIKTLQYNAWKRSSIVVKSGHNFNSFLVSAGLSRLRSILVVPTTHHDTGPSEQLSPFSSSPTTTAPEAYITDFNVRIGGSPVYSQNQTYSYELFQEEILSLGVNGNKAPFMCSGLINQTEWDRSYRYIYVNLNRKSGPAQDDVSKSITIDGLNASGKDLFFKIFVEYQKEIRINVESGQIVLN